MLPSDTHMGGGGGPLQKTQEKTHKRYCLNGGGGERTEERGEGREKAQEGILSPDKV